MERWRGWRFNAAFAGDVTDGDFHYLAKTGISRYRRLNSVRSMSLFVVIILSVWVWLSVPVQAVGRETLTVVLTACLLTRIHTQFCRSQVTFRVGCAARCGNLWRNTSTLTPFRADISGSWCRSSPMMTWNERSWASSARPRDRHVVVRVAAVEYRVG